MQARISVVIPLYNKADYIAEAVRSACEQTPPPQEVIVVNDGSTDGGAEIARALPYPGLRVIDIPNSGVAVARNTGIAAASGDFIAFLDADDWWSPHFLFAIQRLITELPHCSLYGTGLVEVQTGQPLPAIELELVRASPAREIQDYFSERLLRILFFTSSVVVPVHYFRERGIRFAAGESHGEDQDVWFQLAECGPLAFLDLALVAYRRGIEASLTQGYDSYEMLPAYMRLWARSHQTHYPQHLRRGARRIVHHHQTGLARRMLVATGSRDKALRILFFSNYRPGTSIFWWSTLISVFLPDDVRTTILGVDQGWRDSQAFVKLRHLIGSMRSCLFHDP